VRRMRAWAPALLWAAVLFAVSSRPTLPADLGGGLDKVAHFGAFAVLGLLLAHGGVTWRLPIGWPIFFGLAYAATDEIHQAFVPGRYPDAADWVADALGVAAGCFFFYRIRSGRAGSPPSAAGVPADSRHR
jgi:VanZ family protein